MFLHRRKKRFLGFLRSYCIVTHSILQRKIIQAKLFDKSSSWRYISVAGISLQRNCICCISILTVFCGLFEREHLPLQHSVWCTAQQTFETDFLKGRKRKIEWEKSIRCNSVDHHFQKLLLLRWQSYFNFQCYWSIHFHALFWVGDWKMEVLPFESQVYAEMIKGLVKFSSSSWWIMVSSGKVEGEGSSVSILEFSRPSASEECWCWHCYTFFRSVDTFIEMFLKWII